MTNHLRETVTRGSGFLEGFLARQRSSMADRLITEPLRSGRILDIGCGSYPLFLKSVHFAHKYGIDRIAPHDKTRFEREGLNISNFDISQDRQLPYGDGFFDVVTMLAVFEHIEPALLPGIVSEINRVLKRGGRYILTTPAQWTDRLLRLLARCNLVSSAEIEEHKGAYSHASIADYLEKGGFQRLEMSFGKFEAGMNLWAMAYKSN